MCQYFWKPAGVTIDEEKLRNSVVNNPHGWGLLYRDEPSSNGYNPFEFMMCDDPAKDTDPDEIVKLMNDKLKDKDVFLHLRWVTAGDRTVDNIHPFSILERGKKQLFLMHNGTMTDFKPNVSDTRSDTRIFTDTVMTPMAEVMKNPFSWDSWKHVSQVLHKLIGSWSRVMLISSAESVPLLLNYDNHHFENDPDGNFLWLSSNDYSFDPDHRKPKTTSHYSRYDYRPYYENVNGIYWYKEKIKIGDSFINVKKTFAYSDNDVTKAENDVPIGIYLAGGDVLKKGETLQEGTTRILKDVINKNYTETGGAYVVDDIYVIIDMSKARGSNNYLSNNRTVFVYM